MEQQHNSLALLKARMTLNNIRACQFNKLTNARYIAANKELSSHERELKEEIDALTVALEGIQRWLWPEYRRLPGKEPEQVKGEQVKKLVCYHEKNTLKFFKPSVLSVNKRKDLYALTVYQLEHMPQSRYRNNPVPVLKSYLFGNRQYALNRLRKLYEQGKVYRPDLEQVQLNNKEEVEG